MGRELRMCLLVTPAKWSGKVLGPSLISSSTDEAEHFIWAPSLHTPCRPLCTAEANGGPWTSPQSAFQPPRPPAWSRHLLRASGLLLSFERVSSNGLALSCLSVPVHFPGLHLIREAIREASICLKQRACTCMWPQQTFEKVPALQPALSIASRELGSQAWG